MLFFNEKFYQFTYLNEKITFQQNETKDDKKKIEFEVSGIDEKVNKVINELINDHMTIFEEIKGDDGRPQIIKKQLKTSFKESTNLLTQRLLDLKKDARQELMDTIMFEKSQLRKELETWGVGLRVDIEGFNKKLSKAKEEMMKSMEEVLKIANQNYSKAVEDVTEKISIDNMNFEIR